MANAENQQTLIGILVDLRPFDSGWAIGVLRTEFVDHRIVGNALTGLKVGMEYILTGKTVHHPRYGRQFEARVAEIHLPISSVALEKHLCRHFKGIGPTTARKIVDWYSTNDSLEVLRNSLIYDPQSINFSHITNRTISTEDETSRKDLAFRDFSVRLKAIPEIHVNVIKRLAENYLERIGETQPIHDAWTLYQMNPFAPLFKVGHYAFKSADRVRALIGMAEDHPYRLAALVASAIHDGCGQEGHAYLSHPQLLEKIAQLDPRIDASAAVACALQNNEPIVVSEGPRYYPTHLSIAEKNLARLLAIRRRTPINPIFSGNREAAQAAIRVAEGDMGNGFKLDDSQRAAVLGILLSTSSVHTITAGPGCGKTAIMEIVSRIIHHHRHVLFAAPTGKAAKVLTARISHIGLLYASTIHSLLEPNPLGGFSRDATDPINCDVLVVDEGSMIDLELANSLFSATRPETHVIVLGDVAQLPSVGPGEVLDDILKITGFDHHRLTRTHRNQGGLLEVVRMAGNGECDGIDRPDVHFAGALPDASPDSIATVLNLYGQALTLEEGDFSAVSLLIPRRKGQIDTPGWNTTYLNHQLRERYNPLGEKLPGTTWRVGDRILIRKNSLITQPERVHPVTGQRESRSEQVVNGDTGVITGYLMDNDANQPRIKHMTLLLDDSRQIIYTSDLFEELSLAYAMTVHAAQGSEYRRVIFLCTGGAPNFMHRSIVFTALSRAKHKLTIFGELSQLRRVCKRGRPARNSGLVEEGAYVYRQMIQESQHAQP